METLKGIFAFVKAVENGNFVRAGAVLGISSAAVSKNIKRFERSLNVRLFNRSTRRMTLTEEGEFLYERYRKVLEELELAYSQLEQFQGTPSGHLRVTLIRAFGMQVILPMIPEFLSQYPFIVLDLDFENQAGDLISGKFDVGIRSGSFSDGNFIARKLGPMEFKIYGSPSYFARYPKPQAPDDLRNHQCIGFRQPTTGKVMPWEFTRDGAKYNIEVSGPLVVNTQEATCEAGVLGLGLVRLDDFFARPLLTQRKLERVLPEYVGRVDAYWTESVPVARQVRATCASSRAMARTQSGGGIPTKGWPKTKRCKRSSAPAAMSSGRPSPSKSSATRAILRMPEAVGVSSEPR